MHTQTPMRRFWLDLMGRTLLASAGLVVFSFGSYLQLVANVGMNAWNSLNLGLSRHLSISFGSVSILISFLIIIIDLLLREPIGLGTILDALIVGWALDFFLLVGPEALEGNLPLRLVLLLAGLVIMSVGQCWYMRAALSCGPRDALLVALGKRAPKVSIGVINIAMTIVVLAAALLLGSGAGIGTVICIFGTGVVMDLMFKLLRFEPRSVEHQGLRQTAAAFAAARSGQEARHGDHP